MFSEISAIFCCGEFVCTSIWYLIENSFNKSKYLVSQYVPVILYSRSLWPRGLRSGSAPALLLGLRFRIPPEVRMSRCCECCVLSGGILCDGPITRPQESYRLVGPAECDLQTSTIGDPGSLALSSHEKKIFF